MSEEVNIKFIQEHFSYKKGKLYIALPWLESQTVGAEVGYNSTQGYLKCRVLGKEYYVHRLIWALHHKQLTKKVIAHVDGNKTNNNIENLLELSRGSALTLNKSTRKRLSTTGVVGVYKAPKDKYHVYIQVNKNRLFVGTYNDIDEASKAYQEAKTEVRNEIIRENT